MAVHGEATIGEARPFLGCSIAVELEAVAIGIGEVEGLADAVVGGAFKGDSGLGESLQGIPQGWPIGVKKGGVEQPGVTCWRRRPAAALPGIEADVVVVASCGEEGGRRAPALGHLKSKNVLVEGNGTVEVADLEVDVANLDPGVDGRALHARILPDDGDFGQCRRGLLSMQEKHAPGP